MMTKDKLLDNNETFYFMISSVAMLGSEDSNFYMFIQAYMQLEMVYSPACAQTILDNCNSHVFLGSQNFETKTRFTKECGKRTIPNLKFVLNPACHGMVEAY